MKLPEPHCSNERGFILVATMVILLLLVILGLSATMTSTVETQIAGNEKAFKTNFHATDGGIELGELLIEENLSCPGGFVEFPAASGGANIPPLPAAPQARVADLDFAWDGLLAPTDRAAWNLNDFYFPYSAPPLTAEAQDQTYLLVGGETLYAKGGSLQMAAGYMGKGKSAAAGGAYILSTMYAKRQGQSGSLSELMIRWRHMVGQEGTCKY